MEELGRSNPAFPETVRSNFRAIARGGLSTEYLFLACYADYEVSEYLLGPQLTATTTLSVAYDRRGEARAYELYRVAHAAGEFGEQELFSEAQYEDYLEEVAFNVELLLSVILENRESVLFLAPMGAHNAIAVEAWQVVAQWDLQLGDGGVVNAVRYGASQYDPEHSQPFTELVGRVAVATSETSTATTTVERIANVNGLEQYYREIGAYGDITPGDNATTTFTPAQPPPVPACLGMSAVPDPRVNAGLVRDCSILLDAMPDLAGTASLNWNASSSVAMWEGVTLNASSTRVVELDLSDEGLDGTIPAVLGGLPALETLNLSNNDLAGGIPSELERLWNLTELRLSGNSLTGCIPLALRSVALHDLALLGLLYCQPPVPGNFAARTVTESSVALSWDAVPDSGRYRVEHKTATSTAWLVDNENATSTSHTVYDLECGTEYEFRVSALGSGVTYERAWSEPSKEVSAPTGMCPLPPEFSTSTYMFAVVENASIDTWVGRVSATDPNGDPVRYSIESGNDDGRFGIRSGTGAIAVAGRLDFETSPTYSIVVEADDGKGGTAEATVHIEVINVIEVPGVPENLRAAVKPGAVRLEWDAPDDPTVTGYKVLRRQPSIHAIGVFDVIVEDARSVDTFYVDMDVEPQTQYVYRVASVNTDGVSGRSGFANIVTAAAAAPAPDDVSAMLSEGAFTVSWNEVSGTDSYHVQHRIGVDGEWKGVATTTAVTATFSPDGGPECGTTYEFRVRSHGDGTAYAADWGEPSEPASVTTARCNEAPEFGESAYAFVVLEGAATSTVVGTVKASDDDVLTYSITSGGEDGRFSIATSTGQITLAASLGSAGSSYGLTVEADDGYGGTATASVSVRVGAPVCPGGIAVTDPENEPGLVSDCETLLALKEVLAGTASLNWDGSIAITRWDGVTVGGTPKRVTKLALHGEGLTGVIPAALGDLAGLEELRLNHNPDLTGPIPAELGMLSNLSELRIHNSGLTGPIPPRIGDLTGLTSLWLQNNGLTGPICQ